MSEIPFHLMCDLASTKIYTLKNSFSFIICLLLFTSCSKVKFDIINIENLSVATQKVIASSNIPEMKERYLDLTMNEKELLWKAKLKHIITDEKKDLNAKQIEIVQKVLDFISLHGMEKLFRNPELGESFIDHYSPEIEENFSRSQQFLLIELPYFSNDFSLLDSEKILAKLNPKTLAVSMLAATCNCLYNISCPGSGNNCNKTAGFCEPTKDGGCGLTGTSNCKGRCEVFP